MDKVQKILSHKTFLVSLYVLFALTASIQSLLVEPKPNPENGITYTNYNNYRIFERSFHHLKDHQDLYILYPSEHWDLFKYTPSFSVFFGLFASLPDWLGLNLWNLLNAMVLLAAVFYVPRLSQAQKAWVLLIVLLELMGSLMNEQSNGLVAGLLIFAFGLLENKKSWLASLCVVLTVFTKLFGVVGFALFLFYPGKWRMALYTLGWTLLIWLLPFLFIDWEQYRFLFASYGRLLANDPILSDAFSVMGWLHSWFSLDSDTLIVVLSGAGLFLLPLLRIGAYKDFSFRFLTLASILIWVVIFNHKAESPTYVLAMAGVALWFIHGKKSVVNITLFATAMIFTSLTSTDIVPSSVRHAVFLPYALKALPCILIWMKILYDMMMLKPAPSP